MAAADGRRTQGIGTPGPSVALAAAVLIAVAIAGCGGGQEARPTFVGVPETVAIGGLPGPLSGTTVPTLPEITLAPTSTTEPDPDPISGPLVDDVLGHRVLLVGDTALAVTTPRTGGILCDVVTGFGWDVAIEAEPGRPIEFADDVLDELLDRRAGDWDVVGLMFGHHVPTSVDDFERTLDALLERLAPRPVILYTVAELGEQQVEINRLLRARERARPNVVIVDWAEATSAEPDVLLGGDGPVPSEEGAGRLALFTAALLSRVPGDEPGACIEPTFTDDSAIVL